MNHQVLARKWRPTSFETVAGQKHVVQALTNALNKKRLHHAYLFTGTRGVGKTTIARLLAKCLNCETGVTATPCGQCHACIECAEGRFVDLIEVDAASRTKVEDTRELLNNVKYMPTRGRYKIYLIDEVHMLSGHSFNALLKTLEEPPEYVVFLLATTNPKKLPVTVLSRCLQFHLKNLTIDEITDYLVHILQEEHIDFEKEALKQIAKSAKGSMRDALSLLDQVIAFGNGAVTQENAHTLLGTIDQQYIDQLVEAIAFQNGPSVLEISNTLSTLGADLSYILESLIYRLHELALMQVVPESFEQEVDADFLMKLAKQIAPETVQLYYQIALTGRRDLDIVEDKYTGFQMTLLRMLAFTLEKPAVFSEKPSPKFKESSSNSVLKSPASSGQKIPASKEVVKPKPIQEARAPLREETKIPPKETVSSGKNWADALRNLKLSGMASVFMTHCVFKKKENGAVFLVAESQYQPLFSRNIQIQINQALNDYYGEPISLRIDFGGTNLETPAVKEEKRKKAQQKEAVNMLQKDANMQSLLKTFNMNLPIDQVESL